MFNRKNVFAMIQTFNVRVKDAREKDRHHIIEVRFEVPLDVELAEEIYPAMARDLYDNIGGVWTPKQEIAETAFNINPAIQVIEMREHPDLPIVVRIPSVTIRKIVASKGDGNVMQLGFTAGWTLGAEDEPIAIIKRLKTGVYVTFEAQQMILQPDQGGDEERQPTLGDAGDPLSDEVEGNEPDGEQMGVDPVFSGVADAEVPHMEEPGDQVGNVEGAAGEIPRRNSKRVRLRSVPGGKAKTTTH